MKGLTFQKWDRFTKDDYDVFDQYADGDPYEKEGYRSHFRTILDAIKNQDLLTIEMKNGKGKKIEIQLMPKYLEYSEKDDKFRLIGFREGGVYKNLPIQKSTARSRKVIFELVDQRKALERVLLHFANFEKQTERINENHYRVTVNYDRDDETEMVIRILSFGPMIKVTEPDHFANLIKERLIRQKSCGQ